MRIHHVRFAARSAVVAALLLFAGSGAALADAAVPLPSDARAQLDKYLGAGVVGDAVAASALLPADQYIPTMGAVMTYRVLEQGEKPRTETHKVEKTSDPLFSSDWRYAMDPIGGLFIQAEKDGDIVILGEQDLEQKVLSRFTPGQPLIIGGLKPGESRRVTTKVEVSNLSDPTEIDHQGSLDITYTYIGTYKVTVPAGSYDAALIRWDYKGKVGPADIKETLYRLMAPGTGLVAMIESRHIHAPLVYNDKTKLGKLLETRR
jgi:hypothetical protein